MGSSKLGDLRDTISYIYKEECGKNLVFVDHQKQGLMLLKLKNRGRVLYFVLEGAGMKDQPAP